MLQWFPLLRADASLTRQPTSCQSAVRGGDALDEPAASELIKRSLLSVPVLASELVNDAAADEPWIDIGAAGNGNRIVYGRRVLRPQPQLFHVKV